MEPVYNSIINEGNPQDNLHLDDVDTLWEDRDDREESCVAMTFDLPQQQLRKFLKKPHEHFQCLVAAAKKSRTEVSYRNLSREEQEQFMQAKTKELKCWLDKLTR